MIDRQGRLFGKINIIDLAVLLAVLALVVGFLYREKAASSIVNPKTVELKVVCPYVYPPIDEQIKVGDRLIANGAPVDVVITSKEVKPALTTVPRPDGSLGLVTSPYRKDVYLTIKGKTNSVTDAEIWLGGQQVRAGKEDYYVKTRTAELKAYILSVDVK